jgi:SAM-dependent methyltransferase
MHNEKFFDAVSGMIDHGEVVAGLHLLAGSLTSAEAGEAARDTLRQHRLHRTLMRDPYLAHAFAKPRGYAGDAGLIDLIYDQTPPEGTCELGQQLFGITTAFPVSQAVRERLDHASTTLEEKIRSGASVLALACGHLREADGLVGEDLSRLVAVDQDPVSIDRIRGLHGDAIATREANVLSYLRAAARDGERFDFIYTLGLTDYFDDRAMSLLHHLMHRCLNPGGSILLANFLPDHIAVGWMDAVTDWQLIYRDETELHSFAAEIEMESRTWRDSTQSIAWCEMKSAA